MNLKGKVAIVIGGNSGIGAAIVSLSSFSVITNTLRLRKVSLNPQ